ncbi:SQSTM1 [Mytilus edulis]|uniref:SQSTM1 n=1 Tax=Mytilus edulis TaxID=6550 RepID=A0A8S3QAG5_MYTED|nr:SQSTM1 [Mytilus edulis]
MNGIKSDDSFKCAFVATKIKFESTVKMPLVIKAAFIKGDETSEFRRFTVDENLSYEFLKRKITKIFTDKCELMWKDADGDLVSFSSDEELQEALEGVSGGIFRMFVTVDQQKYMKSVPQLKYCNTVNKHKEAGRRLHKAQMMKSPDFNVDHNNGRSIFKIRPGNHESALESLRFHHRRHGNKTQRKSNEEMEAWFNRRQQKWLKRQQEMEHLLNTSTEGNKNQNGENDRLQKRIWRIRNKLAHFKIGDLTPESTNQERSMNSGPPSTRKEKEGRGKFGRQQGKFGLDKDNAVIKLKLKNHHRARSCPGRITGTRSRAVQFGRFNAGRRFGKFGPHHHTAECHDRKCRNGHHGDKQLRNGPFKKNIRKMFVELQDKPDDYINDDMKTKRRCRRQENLEKKIHFRQMCEENKKIPNAWRVKQRGLGNRHGRGMNYWIPRRMRLLNNLSELEEEKNLVQSELKHGCRDCLHKV